MLECVDSLGEGREGGRERGREREREFSRNGIPVTGMRLQRRARTAVTVLRAASEVDKGGLLTGVWGCLSKRRYLSGLKHHPEVEIPRKIRVSR
jgi:hypothetical protein